MVWSNTGQRPVDGGLTEALLQELLEPAFGVAFAFGEAEDLRSITFQESQEELPGGAKTAIERDCAHDGFEGSGQHSIAGAFTWFLADAEVEIRAQVDFPCPADESLRSDERHPSSGQVALVGFGIKDVEILCRNGAQHRVTEKLESFIRQGRRSTSQTCVRCVLHDRAMSQRCSQQTDVSKSEPKQSRQCSGVI